MCSNMGNWNKEREEYNIECLMWVILNLFNDGVFYIYCIIILRLRKDVLYKYIIIDFVWWRISK